MKTLLVEDNPADARLIREMLKDSLVETLQLQQVGRLDSALEQLRQESFDVVLLDLGLPDAQGMQALTLAQEANRAVPIVVLTGRDDERFAAEAVRAGAQDYLVKGRFDSELLVRTIHYAVQRKQAEEEVRRLNAELERRVAERTAQLQMANNELLKKIVERKQAEEALRQSLERLETVLEVETVGVMFWDLNTGCMVDANDTFLKLMGYSRGQVEAGELTWQKLTPPEYMDVSRAEVEKFLATGRVGPYEKEYFRKDGTRQWLLFAGSSLGNNQCVEFCVDISARKKAEEALRASEERWATTLQSIGDAVISTCAQGKIIFMNEVAEKLTGWPLCEAQGRDLDEIFNIVNEVTRSKPESPVAKVVRLGQVVGLANHTALISRSGTEFPIEDSGAPIRDKQGHVTGVVLVFHDISEKRRAEKALRDSERLATTGRLAATLAHEIHNPLDTVGSLLYLIDRAPDVPPTVLQHVSMASEELARVTQMTRHMLSFQRESKNPVRIKIGEVLDSVIALYERKIESAGVQIQKEVGFKGEFLGLPGEMRQVFANLIGNAIEAIGKNGKIRLHAYASRDWRRGRSGLRVTVADNGPGIPAEVRDKIFDPFFTTKGEAGTGLGLWIIAGIVKNNDGMLRIRTVTRTGRSGTCFSVFFPFSA